LPSSLPGSPLPITCGRNYFSMTNRRAVALLVLLWAAALIPGHSLAQQQEEQSRFTTLRLLPDCSSCCWAAALIPGHSLAQQQEEQSGSKRKVVNRVVPAYPQLARTMNLKGTVRIEVLVAPNGVVKSVSVKGGHPVLVQAAENAIQKWRW